MDNIKNNKPINAVSTIAEMTGGIILASFKKSERNNTSYQTEAQLENQLIENLVMQGYERVDITHNDQLYINLKDKIEKLNNISFTASEWQRFLTEFLDAPNDGIIEKTRKIQENHIYDFTFDSGELKNIKIIDKENINNNYLQVINQFNQTGTHKNRYDVTILVNGLPLVHIELKARGKNLKEAFNQIHRYSKESFNTDKSLFKYVQLFIISNGTYTRYFANTTAQSKNNYKFTCEWADAKNKPIIDLEDFTATFLEKRVLLQVITKYCVFDVSNMLLVMRPYQIAATERLLWKIHSSYQNKTAGKVEAGGFIWHTTGSGKTLTSFKAARLASSFDYIDKVFFVVDRKDLDYQTMKEYQKFQKDSVNGSKDTKQLKRNIEKNDSRIIVTTIQKLNEFIKKNPNHPIYNKHCVLIYDECHRSQFGEAQKNIQKSFKKYYQFGFTGTPIFTDNASGQDTTYTVFGVQLHSYVITDAIRDGKVLKFKIDYNNISPKFKTMEEEADDELLDAHYKKMLLHPDRINKIVNHIRNVFNDKTARNTTYITKGRSLQGFNAMFAVQSIEAAKLYYQEFEKQQQDLPENKKLKIATIFSFAANENQLAKGEIPEENFETSTLDLSGKEFLDKVIGDYNREFGTKFSTEGEGFQNYYRDLSQKVKNKEIDILIVVGMFLTGFDAPTLNTLFVDKNLKYHGLIQAFSRTNRILNEVKAFGNIVCFRNLEKATKDAIKLFGDENSINIILEKSYKEYIDGYKEEETGVAVKGYDTICKEIVEKFPDPTAIITESDKKEFAILFGKVLKFENILRNFDEFSKHPEIINERLKQDMRSTYAEIIRESVENKPTNNEVGSQIDYSDIEFQVELLKVDEVNLDYILGLIFEKSKKNEDNEKIKEDTTRLIRSSLGTRAKEGLIITFINTHNLASYENGAEVLKAFYDFAKKEQRKAIKNVIEEENLREDSERFINYSIKNGFVDTNGTELDSILPATSRRGGGREIKKLTVLQKLQKIVEIFMEM